MNRRMIAGLVLALLLIGTMAVSAQQKIPFLTSWNKPGHMNLSATVGWYGWGIDAAVGGELIMGEFDVATIPLDWGVMAKALAGMDLFFGGGISWGVAGVATLHWGLTWGLDIYAGLGVGVCSTYGTPFGIGIASADGVSWKLTDSLFLLADWTYINPIFSGGVSAFGVGVQLKM